MSQKREEEIEDKSSGIIDMDIFGQILEMDDEDDHEFSRTIVWNYFDQASGCFADMDDALERKDLGKLSSLGHFLKGSSAALGVSKVKLSCERIQHHGAKKDEAGTKDIEEDVALKKIETLLKGVKEEYAEAESWLKDFYETP